MGLHNNITMAGPTTAVASYNKVLQNAALDVSKYRLYIAIVYGLAPILRRAMTAAGISTADQNFLVSQMIFQILFETNDLKSKLSIDDNNFSGIKYYGQKNAIASEAHPGYAKYLNPEYWAMDFVKVLQKAPGYPLRANSLSDYVARLKTNRYMEANQGAYYAGLAKKSNLYKALLGWANQNRANIDALNNKTGIDTSTWGATMDWLKRAGQWIWDHRSKKEDFDKIVNATDPAIVVKSMLPSLPDWINWKKNKPYIITGGVILGAAILYSLVKPRR